MARCRPEVAGGPQSQDEEGPGREFERRGCSQGQTGEDRSSALEGGQAQQHQSGHRHIVPAGGEGKGGGGQNGEHLEGPNPGVGGRTQSTQSQQGHQHREHQELDAGVGQLRFHLAAGGEPEQDHAGQVGVVELVGGLVVGVDHDMPVAVDHPVGILAVGGAGAGLLHHDDLGLDMLGRVSLRAPDHLQGQGDQRGPEEDDEEGDHPGRTPGPVGRARPAWPGPGPATALPRRQATTAMTTAARA